MPFGRYLQDSRDGGGGEDVVHFQMPSFMAAPTLAPGGGAEVVPFHSPWIANVGFNAPRPLIAPSPLGLPVYSASGFDLLSILVRVATRPNPQISLGPVDLTCSFVVVDVRRHDSPIVYCSPSFCRLTGYAEHEILGRNCRFLQAPPGPGGATGVVRGEPRHFTSQEAVNALHKACSTDKEVQTSIVNFRRDGTAFINLVSVIPVPGGVSGAKHELGEVAYQIGFQVDLTEQPNVILEKLRDGTYVQPQHPSFVPEPHFPPPKKTITLPQLSMSPILAARLQSKSFLRAFPISSSTTVPQPHSTPQPTNSPLSLLLLEYSPDFIHVVTLKGAFLYVAPAVTRVLGYAPHELVGRSMADLAHPEDVVPLERQLKESSALLPPANSEQATPRPRPIDILFRARTATGVYVWVECRGRLYAEPGKGRKAIILSGRARAMAGRLEWGVIKASAAGGLLGPGKEKTALEFYAQLSGIGHSAGALVHVSPGVKDVLGYTPEELLGQRIGTFLVPEDEEGRKGVEEALEEDRVVHKTPATDGQVKTTNVYARLRNKSGDPVRVLIVFYRTRSAVDGQGLNISRAPLLAQIRLLDTAALTPRKPGIAHPPTANVFAELEVSRGSSWQYELQQLRFANLRLEEEVEALEAELVDFQKQKEAREIRASVDAGDKRGRNNKRKFGDRLTGIGSTAPALSSNAAPPSASIAAPVSSASVPSMGFADIASSGMGLGDIYSDGMGSDSLTSVDAGSETGFSGGLSDTSDSGTSNNFSIALEQYAAASARGLITTTYTTDDGALMPAPAVVPSRHYRSSSRSQHRSSSQQRVQHQVLEYPPQQDHHHTVPAPPPMSMAAPPVPPRIQTPAHSLSRRTSSSQLHASSLYLAQEPQPQPQPQQALYAPVPLTIPVTTTSSSLLGAMGDAPQSQSQQASAIHYQQQPHEQQYQMQQQPMYHEPQQYQQPMPRQYQQPAHQQEHQPHQYQQQQEYQQPMHDPRYQAEQYHQDLQYPTQPQLHSLRAPQPQQLQTLQAPHGHGWGPLRAGR
ncbi:hypothetical protein DXG03_007693 [Asterophora parasitica]|uniref:PAS domain-containing protein n=1 Tax=Asterophora parasitica TaxID=117018 RepID=A0A9P7FYJ2_9AGAR|nr:hypothetical protein DXG03_007693 [Asterophora parasitica]